jgi:hypothetical protein
MSYSFAAPRSVAAIVVLAVNFLALSACTNSNSGAFGSLGPATRAARPAQTCQNGYCWYTVDFDRGAVKYNEITGINDSEEIVGNYTSCAVGSTSSCSGGSCGAYAGGGGACSDCPLPSGTDAYGGINWGSFTATFYGSAGARSHDLAYTVQRQINYPYAQWQYMYGIRNSSNPLTVEVGCVVYPGAMRGTWAVVDNQNLWTIIRPTPDEKACGKTTVTSGSGYNLGDAIAELTGIDSENNLAYGYYSRSITSKTCDLRTMMDTPGNHPATLKLAGSASGWTDYEVSGVSNTSVPLLVGAETTSVTANRTGMGWYACSQTSYEAIGLSHFKSQLMAATGVAWPSTATCPIGANVVGWYVDPTNDKTHGFLLTITSGKSGITQTWTKLDEPNASGYTVISGINDSGDICGWYKNSSGGYDGFVGIVQSGLRRKHQSVPRLIN